jgi:membrane-associated phospholipid phosphatase
MFDLTKPWPLGLDRRTWPLHVAGVLAVLFAVVWFDVWASQGAIHWPSAWRAPFFFITDYGLSDWVVIPTLIVFILTMLALLPMPPGRYRRATYELGMLSSFLLIGVGGSGLLTAIIKRIIGRSRPSQFADAGAFDFQYIVNDWTYQSFPSGHTTTAIAIAFVFGFLWPRLFPVLIVLGVVVGVSRVPVGMHYPTDVVGGIVVGTLGAYATRNAYAARRWLFEIHPDGHIRARGFPAMRRVWRTIWRRRSGQSRPTGRP